MTQPSSTPGRRERKKLETRRAIRETALSLFEQYGYANVTVEQISEAADVSPVTFYRHFGTKENVVISLALTPPLDQAIRELVQARTHQDITDAINAAFVDSASWTQSLWRRLKIIGITPALTDLLWQHTTTWTATASTHFPRGLRSRIFTRCAISALIECALDWANTCGPDDTQALRGLAEQELTPIITAFNATK